MEVCQIFSSAGEIVPNLSCETDDTGLIVDNNNTVTMDVSPDDGGTEGEGAEGAEERTGCVGVSACCGGEQEFVEPFDSETCAETRNLGECTGDLMYEGTAESSEFDRRLEDERSRDSEDGDDRGRVELTRLRGEVNGGCNIYDEPLATSDVSFANDTVDQTCSSSKHLISEEVGPHVVDDKALNYHVHDTLSLAMSNSNRFINVNLSTQSNDNSCDNIPDTHSPRDEMSLALAKRNFLPDCDVPILNFATDGFSNDDLKSMSKSEVSTSSAEFGRVVSGDDLLFVKSVTNAPQCLLVSDPVVLNSSCDKFSLDCNSHNMQPGLLDSTDRPLCSRQDSVSARIDIDSGNTIGDSEIRLENGGADASCLVNESSNADIRDRLVVFGSVISNDEDNSKAFNSTKGSAEDYSYSLDNVNGTVDDNSNAFSSVNNDLDHSLHAFDNITNCVENNSQAFGRIAMNNFERMDFPSNVSVCDSQCLISEEIVTPPCLHNKSVLDSNSRAVECFQGMPLADLHLTLSFSDGNILSTEEECIARSLTEFSENQEHSKDSFVTVLLDAGQFSANGDIIEQQPNAKTSDSCDLETGECCCSVDKPSTEKFSAIDLSHVSSTIGEFVKISAEEIIDAILNPDTVAVSDIQSNSKSSPVHAVNEDAAKLLNFEFETTPHAETLTEPSGTNKDYVEFNADEILNCDLVDLVIDEVLCGDDDSSGAGLVTNSLCDSESMRSMIEECLNSIPDQMSESGDITRPSECDIRINGLLDVMEDFTFVEIDKSTVICSNDESVSEAKEASELEMLVKKVAKHVSFPNDDKIVSSYLSPQIPWKDALTCSTEDLVLSYRAACSRLAIKPLPTLLTQLQAITTFGQRHDLLNLKGESLDWRHCDALEEVLRRVQFSTLDLESTHLDEETSVQMFDMVEYYESCIRLIISNNTALSTRGWQGFARLLKKTPCIEHVEARGCNISDQTMPFISRSLQAACALHSLHLEGSLRSGRQIVTLISALRLNETLQELYLGGNQLMPSDGTHLSNLVKYNTSIQLLDLRNNLLQDVGLAHICNGLCERHANQSMPAVIRTLILWNNQLTHESMTALSRVLADTQSLETLNLGHNNLTNEGIHRLKTGLLQNQSLQRFGLQSTKISCEGAVALAEFIAESAKLVRLDLRANGIKTAGLMALMLSLKVSQTVTAIDLDQEAKKDNSMKDYANQQKRLLTDISNYVQRNSTQQQQQQCDPTITTTTPSQPQGNDSPTIETTHPLLSHTTVNHENGDNNHSETEAKNEVTSRPTLVLFPVVNHDPRSYTLESPAYTPLVRDPFDRCVEDSDTGGSDTREGDGGRTAGAVFRSTATVSVTTVVDPLGGGAKRDESATVSGSMTAGPASANAATSGAVQTFSSVGLPAGTVSVSSAAQVAATAAVAQPVKPTVTSKRKFTVSKAKIPSFMATSAPKSFVSTAVLYTARPPASSEAKESDPGDDDDTHVCIVGTTSAAKKPEQKPTSGGGSIADDAMPSLVDGPSEVTRQLDLHPLIASFSASQSESSAILPGSSGSSVIASVISVPAQTGLLANVNGLPADVPNDESTVAVTTCPVDSILSSTEPRSSATDFAIVRSIETSVVPSTRVELTDQMEMGKHSTDISVDSTCIPGLDYTVHLTSVAIGESDNGTLDAIGSEMKLDSDSVLSLQRTTNGSAVVAGSAAHTTIGVDKSKSNYTSAFGGVTLCDQPSYNICDNELSAVLDSILTPPPSPVDNYTDDHDTSVNTVVDEPDVCDVHAVSYHLPRDICQPELSAGEAFSDPETGLCLLDEMSDSVVLSWTRKEVSQTLTSSPSSEEIRDAARDDIANSCKVQPAVATISTVEELQVDEDAGRCSYSPPYDILTQDRPCVDAARHGDEAGRLTICTSSPDRRTRYNPTTHCRVLETDFDEECPVPEENTLYDVGPSVDNKLFVAVEHCEPRKIVSTRRMCLPDMSKDSKSFDPL